MSYITPAQLVEGQGMLRELAELFELEAELLAATIAGGDRSAWSAEQIAAADQALVSIQNTCDRADAEINSYLVRRGYALPLSASAFPVLTTYSRAIVRYHAQPQRDKTNEETGRIERDYRGTLRTLEQIAAGRIGLGADDPLVDAGGSAGSPEFTTPVREFTRDTLADF